jgi:hypothetical protein
VRHKRRANLARYCLKLSAQHERSSEIGLKLEFNIIRRQSQHIETNTKLQGGAKVLHIEISIQYFFYLWVTRQIIQQMKALKILDLKSLKMFSNSRLV